jgi:hypothetical protein
MRVRLLPNLAMVAGLLLRLLVSVRSIGLWLRKELAHMNDEFSDEYLIGFALGRRIPNRDEVYEQFVSALFQLEEPLTKPCQDFIDGLFVGLIYKEE